MYESGPGASVTHYMCSPLPSRLRALSITFTLSKIWEWLDTVDRFLRGESLSKIGFLKKHTSASYSDRADTFFTDYRLMPLMVQVRHFCRFCSNRSHRSSAQRNSPHAQENYIKVRPAVSRAEIDACGGDQNAAAAARCAAAADALSDLDLVDRTLVSTQSWSLLPLEARRTTQPPCAAGAERFVPAAAAVAAAAA